MPTEEDRPVVCGDDDCEWSGQWTDTDRGVDFEASFVDPHGPPAGGLRVAPVGLCPRCTATAYYADDLDAFGAALDAFQETKAAAA